MKKEKQRIAIAEACGWKRHSTRPSETERHQKKWRFITDLPDYLNDLNAMHEAEKVLGDEHWEGYTLAINADMRAGNATILKAICHATAAQRAEAFLRTIGKWEDEP